jgi:sec-independent protein translocase protein TatC
MPKVLRPIGHEERLSVVDHLDELRTRLISAVLFLVVIFAVCFWQNHALLNIVNQPLSHVHGSPDQLNGVSKNEVDQRHGLFTQARGLSYLLSDPSLDQIIRRGYKVELQGVDQQIKALPKKTQKDKPVTLGIGEPFTTTLTVVFYFSILFALPMLLYQLFAFVIPALAPNEQKIAKPIVIIAPLLFAAGVVFTYFLVLPPAVEFLQGYNNNQFDSLVQAAPYYKFEILLMGGVGLAFQVPLVLLALQRAGIVGGSTLTGNWRYGILIIAVIVAALPGVDPVTMFFEALPLVILYLASIVLLKIFDRRDAKRAREESLQSADPPDQNQ